MLTSILQLLDDGEGADLLGRAGRQYARERLSRVSATERIVGFTAALAAARTGSEHRPVRFAHAL